MIPVKVPWRIAPSTPFLKLTVNEFEPAQVEFLAHFNPHISDKEDERIVTITFTGVWCFRGTSAPDEGYSPINESSYDWSEIQPPLPREAEALDAWTKQFNHKWESSKICPDPGMYEVRNSDWSSLAQSDKAEYTHFLIVGEAKYVEILSRTWSWHADDKTG